MVNIRKVECPSDKEKIKCPYTMTPTRIVIHNTANDASAANEITYMHSNNNETSFHFAVDDKEIVQGIELNRNAWHASDGNGKGNREGIAIEICYSKSGGARFETAQKNAAELTAKLLNDFGWEIDRVTKHHDYSGKHCPHRTLDDYGWDYFLNLVKSFMGAETAPAPAPSKPDVTYQVWDDVKNKWLPNVKNDSDYAGLFGHDVCAVLANLSSGNIFYKVHYKGGKWLPEVTNRTDYAGLFNRPIDGLMMKTDTGVKIYYRVHLRRKNKWLPWVTGYSEKDGNNGYAGILGQEIDAVQIRF
ncbi:MAG: N-acetylmuramoyl-L-alanine amidase family protein [Acutalibacteraceae bacterium]